MCKGTLPSVFPAIVWRGMQDCSVLSSGRWHGVCLVCHSVCKRAAHPCETAACCRTALRHLVVVTTTTVRLHPFAPFSVQPGRPSHWSCLALSSSCEPQDNTVCMRVFSRHDTAHPCERFSLCSGVLSWWQQVCLLLVPSPTHLLHLITNATGKRLW